MTSPYDLQIRHAPLAQSTNTGEAEGHRCVTAYVYKDGNIVKSQNVCETIAANDNENARVSYSEYSRNTYDFTYYCNYS